MNFTLAEIIDSAEEYIEKMLDNGHESNDEFIRRQRVIIAKAQELARLVDWGF